MTKKQPIWWAVGALVGFSLAAGTEGSEVQPTRVLSQATAQRVKLYDFPPPNAVYQIQGTTASVTIFNGSPEPLEITLTNGLNERTILRFAPCPNCSTYAPGQGPQDCEAESVPTTYYLNPGEYESKAVFKGQTWGFRSRWVLSSGWEHKQCVFSTYGVPGGPY
ncbi:hypothetical protein [Pseudanabaena sp. FACHB-2040]|uniref:hypothetical protein n=1 Tax=Pseudanabaena sp. FACHB-2040 TaxID=2692859 RepID=UPI0016864726|nr:hypothetical protein [Pseudanabaena sp. FACHB-2040]MBD2258880.1 hypothetical protein [Pseudanabaena sp. FACHB-2040]